MICIDTDRYGVRTYRLPKALVDVAVELFVGMNQNSAVFCMAKAISWDDCHTIERIALNNRHAEAVEFARARLAKSLPVSRFLNLLPGDRKPA